MTITLDDLSKNQIAALREIAAGRNISSTAWSMLHAMDLVDMGVTEDGTARDVLLPLGAQLLAEADALAAPTAPTDDAQAGEAVVVDPARRYENYTCDDLLARVIDQDRIIHELYTGKHGVIPHPADVYQAGLWEIYKPDQYQGHAERVGDVGELARVKEERDQAYKSLADTVNEFDRELTMDKAEIEAHRTTKTLLKSENADLREQNTRLADELARARGAADQTREWIKVLLETADNSTLEPSQWNTVANEAVQRVMANVKHFAMLAKQSLEAVTK